MSPVQRPTWYASLSRFGILIGLIVVLIGFVVGDARMGEMKKDPVSMGIAIGGAVLSVLCILYNFAWFIEVFTHRRTITGVNQVVMMLLATVFFGMIGYVNARHYFFRWDVTKNKRFSLDEVTLKILKDLPQEITIYMAFDRSGEAFLSTGMMLTDLLERYDRASDKVKYEFVDVLKEPGKVTALAKLLKVDRLDKDVIVIECGDKAKKVSQYDMVDYSGMGPMGGQPQFKGEEVLTGAILSVTEESPKIYFVIGHGECVTDDLQEQYGYGVFARELKDRNFAVETIMLSEKKEIPPDCSVLVIAGPRSEYKEEEIATLRNYFDRNGSALILLDPIAAVGRKSGLEDLLKNYKVEAETDAILWTVAAVMGGQELTFEVLSGGKFFGNHPIVDPVKNFQAGFINACVIKPLDAAMPEGAPPMGGPKATALVNTMEMYFTYKGTSIPRKSSEITKGAKNPASFCIGVAVESATPPQNNPYMPPPPAMPGPRMVVFGTSSAFSNLGMKLGNFDLAMNTVNWLAKKDRRLGIGMKSPDMQQIILKEWQKKAVTWGAFALLPGLVGLVGLCVYFVRRR